VGFDSPKLTPPNPSEPLICIEELARLCDVTPSLIYKMAREGNLPYYRVGVAIRFDRQEAPRARWMPSTQAPPRRLRGRSSRLIGAPLTLGVSPARGSRLV
jgi:excisionase family DNA binding protein